MKEHKICLLALLAAFVSFSAFSLEVDEDELKTTGQNDSIVFINYTGPHSKIDSLDSIKKLGSDLGTVVARDTSKATSAGNSSRYSVIHAVDPSETGKLDADIIFIGADATVDHINNLRHIIASYLVSAYGYSEKDAETVAVFVTVYNAVYRGKLDTFQNKYKKVVTNNLTSTDCGLSVTYSDWPGHSQIVIPLYDVNGGLSTVDTSVISDTQVVQHMQEDDDKNVESRKEMVDIKEREAENANQKAQEAQKTAVQEQNKLNEQKQKTETARQEAETAKKEAETAQKKADENPNNKAAQKEAAQKQAVAEEKQEAYEEQQSAQEEQQKTTDEAKQTAQEQQAVADKKTSEAQEERKTIAKDQAEVIKKEIENAVAPSAYGIELTNDSSLLSGLVKVNTATGEVIKSSPVTYIRNRTMFQAGENFVAIAGENKGNGTVKLVLLSPDTMEITKESNETVAEDSVLVQDSGEYYCVIKDGKNYKLAKYDSDLNLKLRSSVNVKSATPVTVATNYVIVTDSSGTVKVLNKSNLEEVNAVQSAKNAAIDIINAK